MLTLRRVSSMDNSFVEWILHTFTAWTKNGSIISPPISCDTLQQNFVFGTTFSGLIEPAFVHFFQRLPNNYEKSQISIAIRNIWGPSVKTKNSHLYCLKFSHKSGLESKNIVLQENMEKWKLEKKRNQQKTFKDSKKFNKEVSGADMEELSAPIKQFTIETSQSVFEVVCASAN